MDNNPAVAKFPAIFENVSAKKRKKKKIPQKDSLLY